MIRHGPFRPPTAHHRARGHGIYDGSGDAGRARVGRWRPTQRGGEKIGRLRAALAETGETARIRATGGLEVRVGRGSKENDRLTFRESAPNDVWLHARSVPGSHVILRWPDADAAPPARDLAEAAQLAALFSRAPTSSLVAVDWTRRMHVRRPRGSLSRSR